MDVKENIQFILIRIGRGHCLVVVGGARRSTIRLPNCFGCYYTCYNYQKTRELVTFRSLTSSDTRGDV